MRTTLANFDLKLPKQVGFEILKKLEGDAFLKHTPVVMVTSSREDRDLLKSYMLVVNAYVVKPIGFGQFFEAIRGSERYGGVEPVAFGDIERLTAGPLRGCRDRPRGRLGSCGCSYRANGRAAPLNGGKC